MLSITHHVITVTTVAACIAVMCWFGRRNRGTQAGRRIGVALSLAVWALWISYQVYDYVQYGFEPENTLPLQMCDLTAVFAALVFVRPTRQLQSLTYFWALALSTQAIITPDLAGGPDSIAFWWFWLYHLLVVGAGVYVVAVQGFRPEWPDLRFALVAGLVYAVVIFAIDALFGLNYGYLGRATPSRPTILDVLGPWPIRCVFMVLLGSAAMTVLWLPWLLVRRSEAAREFRTR